MIPDETQETNHDVEDELYDEAVQSVAELQTASVSMLQRRFSDRLHSGGETNR